MKRNIKISINVLLLKKNSQAFINALIPDEEKDLDIKTFDLKVKEVNEGKAKGRGDYVSYSLECDSRKTVYEIFYKHLSDRKGDLEHYTMDEAINRFLIKEMKAISINLDTREEERFDYVQDQGARYSSTIPTDFWSNAKTEATINSYQSLLGFINKAKEEKKDAKLG